MGRFPLWVFLSSWNWGVGTCTWLSSESCVGWIIGTSCLSGMPSRATHLGWVEPWLIHPGRQVHLEPGPSKGLISLEPSCQLVMNGRPFHQPPCFPIIALAKPPGQGGSRGSVAELPISHPLEGKPPAPAPGLLSRRWENREPSWHAFPRRWYCGTKRKFKTNAKKTDPSIFALFLCSFNKYLLGPWAVS